MSQPSFSVDTAQLKPVADNIWKLHDVLAEIADRNLQPHAEASTAVFGEYGAAHAWTDLLRLWAEELRCAGRTAEHWGTTARLAIRDYELSDANSAGRQVTG